MVRWNKIVDRSRKETKGSNSDVMKKWVYGHGENAPWVKVEIDEPASWEAKKPGYYVKSSGSLADRVKTQKQAMKKVKKRKKGLEQDMEKHFDEYVVKYNETVGDPAHGGNIYTREKVVEAANAKGAEKKFKDMMDRKDYSKIRHIKRNV